MKSWLLKKLKVVEEYCIIPTGISKTPRDKMLIKIPLVLTRKHYSICYRKECLATLYFVYVEGRGPRFFWLDEYPFY
jgi:hypothetical protein